MTDNFEDEILGEFLVEANESLEQIDRDFIALEKNPADEDLINGIFRGLHTIKGTSGFLGLHKLEQVSHISEDILSKVRSGKMVITPDIVTLLLESLDSLKEIMSFLSEKKGEGETDYTDLLHRLANVLNDQDESRELPSSALEITPPPPAAPDTPDALLPSEEAPLKVEEPKDAVEAVPQKKETVEKKVSLSSTESPSSPRPKPPASSAVADSSVRVDIGLLDTLMNLVGELVLSRNQILQSLENDDFNSIRGGAQRLNHITADLQISIMKTRMQPIGNVFNKFPRVVRDLTRLNKKLIKLVLQGEETEVDKSLLEAIKDPLMHIVRNSVDHGVEGPEEREENKKDPEGRLLIRAYHENGQVIIEIQDDGAGIDPQKVKNKALEKGVITADVAEKMTPKDLQTLIFRPGFSTAEKVTNISGRGVGMDVVRTNVEKVGGTIDLLSEVGQGTTLKLQIPLTLAIIPALIVMCDGHRYTIPQMNIQKLIYLEGEAAHRAVERIHTTEVFRHRGNLLPLIRLRNILQLKEQGEEKTVEEKTLFIVVLQAGHKAFGVVVDQVLDSEEIVVKPIVSDLKQLDVYSGSTILGDGEVALILDPAGIEKKGGTLAEESENDSASSSEEDDAKDIQSLLLFSIGSNEPFGLPIPIISRVEEILSSGIKRMGGKEVIPYQGALLQLVRLETHMDITPLETATEYSVIVFDFSGKKIGLLVNRILDSIDTTTGVDTDIATTPGVLGTIMVKEQPVLLIDIYKIMEKEDPDFFEKKNGAGKNMTEKGRRILLVEDSPFFLNLEKSYLESGGFVVETAMDGIEGLAMTAKNSYHLIITDLEMPRMGGLEFIEKLRTRKGFDTVPVMAVTSLTGEEERAKAFKVGIDDYRIKINREEILDGVWSLLEKGRKSD